MKVAVLADIHANLPSLKAVFSRMEALDFDKIILAGDLVGYGPHPNEVIGEVLARNIISIRGNHDDAALSGDSSGMNPYASAAAQWTSFRMLESSKTFLEELPARRVLEIGGRKICLCHGSPEDPLEYVFDRERAKDLIAKSTYDVIVVGHTHVPMVEYMDDRLFLNPGAVGQPRDSDPKASFAELDLDTLRARVIRVEYDVKATQEKMVDLGLPTYLAKRLEFGR